MSGAQAPGGPTTYSYDPVGNRLSRVRPGETVAYGYDKADRLLLGLGYTYDGNGNLPVGQGGAFSYDGANRLRGAGYAGFGLSYGYDGDGKRASVTKDVGGGGAGYTVRQVHDANRALAVVLADRVSGANAPPSRTYVYGLGGAPAYAVDASGNVEVFHPDGLGSVRALTDAAGQVVQTYRADEFGVPDPAGTQGGRVQPYQYTGEERDGNGLVYLRARTYRPDLGRLLQRDPWRGALADPQSLNPYAYAQNNPVTLTDPSGLAPLKANLLEDQLQCFQLFGGLRICLPGTGSRASQIQPQTQLPPCPTGYGAGHPTSIGTLGRADYQYASGPEKSGGGRYACHVNTRAGNLNRHITYNQAAKAFESDLPSPPLGGDPVTAAHIVAILEAYYLSTTNKLPSGLPNIGGYSGYRDWYLAPPPGGNLADRLARLMGYAP